MTDVPPPHAYRVVTPRLMIRCWDPRDAPALQQSIDRSIEHLTPWMPWAALEPQTLDAKIDLLRRFRGGFDYGQDFVFGIFSRDGSEVLGGTGLHPRVGGGGFEIGYWVDAKHAGRGYATEAAAAMTRVGFEILRLPFIEIRCRPENVRSAHVARKLGFTHEATLRQRLAFNGTNVDVMVFVMFPGEYAKSRAVTLPYEAYDAADRRLE